MGFQDALSTGKGIIARSALTYTQELPVDLGISVQAPPLAGGADVVLA